MKSPGSIYKWREQFRKGQLHDHKTKPTHNASSNITSNGKIEIYSKDGWRIVIDSTVDDKMLTRVLDILKH